MKEFFSLRAAARRAEALSPDGRERALTRLRLARQRDAAAGDLWVGDHRAEGLRLAREALAETLGAAEALPPVETEAACALLEPELPSLDDEVADVDVRRFEAMRAARRRLDAALAPALHTPRDLAALRVMRASLVAAGVALAGAGVVLWVTRPPRGVATASAHHPEPPGFAAARALDGDAYTEWLLPPYQTGWLDVTFSRPRALAAVRLLNAHNRSSNDMATREYRVEAYAGARVVATFQGAFPTLDPQPEWYRAPLAAAGVTRVRVWVDSFHRGGAGLAEVDFE